MSDTTKNAAAAKPDSDDLLKVTIDGKECECQRGEYVYDVAMRNGIYIPTLCRHEAFDHRACCRVCIVEVETRGRRKVVTSCVYPIEQECSVFTNSDKIKEERSLILTLLNRRAPDSNEIATMGEYYNASKIERLISIDNEKCILCGLCVQACDSLGTGAISTVNRGTAKAVDTPYGRPSVACVGCVSCANVCPTGAIEFKETATTRTIWDQEFELKICPECGEVMGTVEQVALAAEKAEEEVPEICDECKKRHIAEEFLETYRRI